MSEPNTFWELINRNPRQLIAFAAIAAVSYGVRVWFTNYYEKRTEEQKPTQEIFLKVYRSSFCFLTLQKSGPIELIEINVYPIKSCKGFSVPSWKIDKYGLEYDRKWVIVKSDTKRFVTIRVLPQMSLIVPTITEDFLVLNAPGMEEFKVPLGKNQKEGPIVPGVSVWDHSCDAVDEGDEVADWISKYIGNNSSYRLMRRHETHERDYPAEWSPKDAIIKSELSFQDGFPFLVASVESLEDLNSRLTNKLPMNRFRTNFVVKGVPYPFAEDDLGRFKIGDTVFRGVKKCTRCKATTVNQESGTFDGEEPLKTLHTFREGLLEGKQEVCFAENLIHENYNTQVTVGQFVELLN